MTYLNTKRYRKEGNVLYNNVHANSLYGVYLDPSQVSKVGNYQKAIAGSFLTADKRLLGAGKVLAPYTAGDPGVIVNNPWSMQVGDVLYVIGDETTTPADEKTAYDTQAVEFGTVLQVNPGETPYRAVFTPSAIAVGDIYTLTIEEVSVSVTAETTVALDLIELLIAELNRNGRSNLGSLDYLNYEPNAINTALVFEAKETGTLFSVNTDVVGAGTFDVVIGFGIGTVRIAPGAGNANLDIGTKLSTVGSQVLGVLAHTKYLNDSLDQDMVADTAAYDTANVYTKSLPYLDGAIVSQLPTLKFMPPYGS